MFVPFASLYALFHLAPTDALRCNLPGVAARRRRQQALGWLAAAALLGHRLGAAEAHAAPAPDPAARPALPVSWLSHAVFEAISPPTVWQGGTTPKASVLTDDNELGELVVGTPAVNEALAASIRAAQHEVLLQIYEWSDEDEATLAVRAAVADRLAAAAADPEQRPFRLGIVLSQVWLSENRLSHDRLARLLRTTCSAEAPHLRCELLLHRGSLLDILHSKLLVVDGAEALVMTGNLHTHGGLQQDAFNVAAPVRGPVVAALQQDFAHAHARSHAVVQRSAELAWLAADEATVGERQQAAGGLQRASAQPVMWAAEPRQAAVLSRPADWSYFARGDHNPQARGLLALFAGARYSICAINPALNVKAYKTALVEAIVQRGVQVTLLLSYHMNKTRQHWLMGGDNADTAAELYEQLLARGGPAAARWLRIYWGTSDDGQIAPAYGPGNVHAKIASFDGEALLVGSTNWDWPSYNSAREVSVALFGAGVGARFEREVLAPRLAASRAIRAEDLPRPSEGRFAAAHAYLLGEAAQ